MALAPYWGVDAMDKSFLFKQAVKEIANKHKMLVSFIPKPFQDQDGSGCHFNHSLWDKDHKTNHF